MISKSSSEMVAESALSLPEHHIGSRIECCEHYGTIKYIGPVEGHPGVWLGIDWDDVSRGKHNGTVNGVQYFEARYPKSGSFVRREKVNFGQTAINSIVTRYRDPEDDELAKIREEQLLSFQKSMNAPFLELVGFDKIIDKQSDFKSLQVVNLRLQNVSSPGAPLELKQLCPNIRELDASKNLFSTWLDIFDICSQLEHLYWLNVSENLMVLPDNFSQFNFPNITVLICGYMNLSWSDIIKLSIVFPNIQELRVPYNNITFLTSNKNALKHLRLLDLEGNQIGSWSEIMKLSELPNIQQMNLENIQLTTINIGENLDVFSNLKKLNLNNNLLNEWQSVGELNKLCSLEDLRISKNPILETETVANRDQLIISKIANLSVLNGRLITAEERRGAEYDYIKKYGLEWLKVKNTPDKENFLSSHNRYLELITKHGAAEESELIIKPNILNSSLITLHIIYKERTIAKKLPPTILVQKLMMLVEKLFKLEDRPRLKYVSSIKSDIAIELDDEMKEISYYAVQDGDKIIVQI